MDYRFDKLYPFVFIGHVWQFYPIICKTIETLILNVNKNGFLRLVIIGTFVTWDPDQQMVLFLLAHKEYLCMYNSSFSSLGISQAEKEKNGQHFSGLSPDVPAVAAHQRSTLCVWLPFDGDLSSTVTDDDTGDLCKEQEGGTRSVAEEPMEKKVMI